MSIELLERAATALGPLRDEVAFVGGAAVTLWITDPGAPPPRPTKDVDVIAEIASRLALHRFESRMRDAGFLNDVESGIICRWRHGPGDHTDLLLDLMPTDASLLGFANRWQGPALHHATPRALPSGACIRAIPPAYLLATKLKAFTGRGHGDHIASHDLEDVILLIDGREQLAAEIASAPVDVRTFVTETLGDLLAEPRFVDAIPGHLRADATSQARAHTVVLPRIRTISGNG